MGAMDFDFTQTGGGLAGSPFGGVFPDMSRNDAAYRQFADVLRYGYLKGLDNRTPAQEKVFQNLSARPGNFDKMLQQYKDFAKSTNNAGALGAIRTALSTGEGLGAYSGQQDLSQIFQQGTPLYQFPLQATDFWYREAERQSQKEPGGFFQNIADRFTDPLSIALMVANPGGFLFENPLAQDLTNAAIGGAGALGGGGSADQNPDIDPANPFMSNIFTQTPDQNTTNQYPFPWLGIPFPNPWDVGGTENEGYDDQPEEEEGTVTIPVPNVGDSTPTPDGGQNDPERQAGGPGQNIFLPPTTTDGGQNDTTEKQWWETLPPWMLLPPGQWFPQREATPSTPTPWSPVDWNPFGKPSPFNQKLAAQGKPPNPHQFLPKFTQQMINQKYPTGWRKPFSALQGFDPNQRMNSIFQP